MLALALRGDFGAEAGVHQDHAIAVADNPDEVVHRHGPVVRVAVGWREGDLFLAIAHSAALETPPGEPSAILA